MGYKIILFVSAIVVAANAGIIASPYSAPAYGLPVAKVAAAPVYSAPVAKIAAPAYAKVAVPEPYDPHPQYNYAYEINDQHTGDVKSQQEWRDGDVVKGYYSLIEPDGTKRTVEYEADPHNGFNAVVHREHGAAPVVAKVAAPVAYAAPIAKVAAPVAYAAPIAKVAAPLAYTAPVAKVAGPLAYTAPVAKVAAPLAYGAPVAKVAAPYYGGYH